MAIWNLENLKIRFFFGHTVSAEPENHATHLESIEKIPGRPAGPPGIDRIPDKKKRVGGIWKAVQNCHIYRFYFFYQILLLLSETFTQYRFLVFFFRGHLNPSSEFWKATRPFRCGFWKKVTCDHQIKLQCSEKKPEFSTFPNSRWPLLDRSN